MNRIKIFTLFFIAIVAFTKVGAQKRTLHYNSINSGVPWYDNRDSIISAHGANIIREKGIYYLFGEAHSDTSNAFNGFNCYSSTDLYNWKFESVALQVQLTGKLGPNRVGERPKVMRCPATGKYMMYMHVDSINYKDQYVGYATSDNISGPYIFKGPLLFNGKPIRKWDMGTFQDKDGSGYVLLHGGDIYQLSKDYTAITKQVNKAMTSGFESPAVFRKGDIYYFLGSNLTSWEKNDNYYFTARSLSGPWTRQGFFAPKGTLTWNSQTTFVLPIYGTTDTAFMFMGDRWSYPKQASAATYVWQPMQVSGKILSIPVYRDRWQIDLKTGRLSTTDANATSKITTLSYEGNNPKIHYTGSWQTDSSRAMKSDHKGDRFNIGFKGTGVSWTGLSSEQGGYARTVISRKNGEILYSAIIDMYCLYPGKSVKYISPRLRKGNYRLTVTVMGEHPSWSDKRKSNYGSTGDWVTLDHISVLQ